MRARDMAMSKARRDLDWDGQFTHGFFPEQAKAIRDSRSPQTSRCAPCVEISARTKAPMSFSAICSREQRNSRIKEAKGFRLKALRSSLKAFSLKACSYDEAAASKRRHCIRKLPATRRSGCCILVFRGALYLFGIEHLWIPGGLSRQRPVNLQQEPDTMPTDCRDFWLFWPHWDCRRVRRGLFQRTSCSRYLTPGTNAYLGDFLLYRRYLSSHWQRLGPRIRDGVRANERSVDEPAEQVQRADPGIRESHSTFRLGSSPPNPWNISKICLGRRPAGFSM